MRYSGSGCQSQMAREDKLISDKILIVDAETTDLLTNDPLAEIVEIGAAVLNLRTWTIEGSLISLVQHSRPMSAFTSKSFAGVSFEKAPPLDYVLECLLNLWTEHGGAWFGQNPHFDLSFIKPAVKACGLSWPEYPAVDYHVFDLASMVLPYVLRGEIESVSLSKSRVWAGCKGQQLHRAGGDVQDCISVLGEVIARTRYHHVEAKASDVLREQVDQCVKSFALDRSLYPELQ